MCECPSRRSGVHWIEIDGDVVLTDPDVGSVHVLRGAAAAVWQLLDGDPIGDLPELVAEIFGLDADEAAEYIAEAIELLAAIGVLTFVGAGQT